MRAEFSRKTRRLAWERANEMCERIGANGARCCAPLGTGRFEYDHVIADWMGGDNSLDNCMVICLPCHARKTAVDVGAIAKVKRIRDRRSKSLTSKRPMPFGRGSKFKRKLDGTVVRR